MKRLTLTIAVLMMAFSTLVHPQTAEAPQVDRFGLQTRWAASADAVASRPTSVATVDELLADARVERDRTLKEAQTMANQLIETAKTKATEEGTRLITQAREAIQNEKNAALAEVRNTAAQLSLDIAERILRRELADPAAQSQLVDAYLKDVKLN